MDKVTKELFLMQDAEYKKFQAKLIPTVNPDVIIGVRTPNLRKYAKELFKTPDAAAFLKELPHKYYEENCLHAFITECIKDYETALFETERFLPYIDNWATCDTFVPKVFKKNTDALLKPIKKWLKSKEIYTVRYAIGLLMGLYLDEKFEPEQLRLVAGVKSEEYYVNMMIAWYFATALAKQYDSAISYIPDKKLDKWVHNKTIQKAIESRRISAETKDYLRTLKMK